MTLDLINFVPNTKIKASEVNTNFSLLNNELSTTQGTVEQLNQTVTAGVVPTGAIFWFPIDTPPNGYLICDGTAVSRSTYAALYTVIGTKYGAGDGTTTFNLPNLADGRFVKGALSAGYSEDAVVGTHTHTALIDSVDAHTHNYDYEGKSSGLSSPTSPGGLLDGLLTKNSSPAAAKNTSDGGGAHTHNITIYNNAEGAENKPKSLSLLPCIKY